LKGKEFLSLNTSISLEKSSPPAPLVRSNFEDSRVNTPVSVILQERGEVLTGSQNFNQAVEKKIEVKNEEKKIEIKKIENVMETLKDEEELNENDLLDVF
jgi:predicted alternative tryptophan synthase beta-subunit